MDYVLIGLVILLLLKMFELQRRITHLESGVPGQPRKTIVPAYPSKVVGRSDGQKTWVINPPERKVA